MNSQSPWSLRWLPYRVIRRFAFANISNFYQSPIDRLPRTPTPKEYEIFSCSSERLREHASGLDYQIPQSEIEKITAGEAKCFTAFRGNALAGFAWVAFGSIPGEMNHNGKPETGLPIQLAADSAFVYQVFVLPAHRGRRLYAAIVSRMAEELSGDGIRTLVLTTEGSNQSATLAVERMQFRKVGQSTFFRIGPVRKVKYPLLPNDVGFTIGRYRGDNAAGHLC